MKNFNFKKYLFAVIAVFVLYQALDYVVHMVLLKESYSELSELWRPDMDNTMWIMYVSGLIFSIFMVYMYHFFCNGYGKTGWKAGLYFSLILAFLTTITGVLGQFMVYAVPSDLMWEWMIYGTIETAIVGSVMGLIYKPLEISE